LVISPLAVLPGSGLRNAAVVALPGWLRCGRAGYFSCSPFYLDSGRKAGAIASSRVVCEGAAVATQQ